MGQNKLSELPHGLLDHMTHLESLIINCNNLKTFPIGLLRNNKFVTEFELDNDSERCLKSRKTSVPNDMFLSRYIQNITFRNVAINRLPERWLSNCSGNTLLNIKSNTFKNWFFSFPCSIIVGLLTLIMNHCELQFIPSKLFLETPFLCKLELNNNQIKTLNFLPR